jgi:hypothetical protein
MSRHENGHKRPGPYYQALYCEVYGTTPAELGFRLALPSENGHHEDVDRREFLAGAAGFVATAALPDVPSVPTRRLGDSDVAHLRQSVRNLYDLSEQHGEDAAYGLTTRLYFRLRGLAERTSYDAATGRALRELAGEVARRIGSINSHVGRYEDARHWQLEAMHWARLADADWITVGAMASMTRQASEQRRPREAIDLATTAQRTAGPAATPRLRSMLLVREALGHAGARDAKSARGLASSGAELRPFGYWKFGRIPSRAGAPGPTRCREQVVWQWSRRPGGTGSVPRRDALPGALDRPRRRRFTGRGDMAVGLSVFTSGREPAAVGA